MDDHSTLRDLSWRVRLVVLGILLAVLVIFIVANSGAVTVNFVIAEIPNTARLGLASLGPTGILARCSRDAAPPLRNPPSGMARSRNSHAVPSAGRPASRRSTRR